MILRFLVTTRRLFPEANGRFLVATLARTYGLIDDTQSVAVIGKERIAQIASYLNGEGGEAVFKNLNPVLDAATAQRIGEGFVANRIQAIASRHEKASRRSRKKGTA